MMEINTDKGMNKLRTNTNVPTSPTDSIMSPMTKYLKKKMKKPLPIQEGNRNDIFKFGSDDIIKEKETKMTTEISATLGAPNELIASNTNIPTSAVYEIPDHVR